MSTLLDPVARFWRKVDRTGECWLWTGATGGRGYGLLSRGGRLVGAHRYSWELANGAIPPGLVIDHLCETKLCVRPEHLQLATQAENILRGDGLGARNARKTHCDHGHRFDAANTHMRADGTGRDCKACWRRRAREKRAA